MEFDTKNSLGLLILFGLSVLPAAAQSVTIDYAHDHDFKTVKTKPEKVTQQINNIITKLGEKWKKILAGTGE